MGRLVDLVARPYYLSVEQIRWVDEMLAAMSDEEKTGQLFINLFFLGGGAFSDNPWTNQEVLDRFHVGGAMYHGGHSTEVQRFLNELQSHTKIPLIIAANCDAGGNGACSDGTYVASGAQCQASRDTEVAHNAGADVVIDFTSAYIQGLKAEGETICCIKHYPGDGTEERVQHLVLGVNELSPQEWDASFGRVYRHHIRHGVEMIKAGTSPCRTIRNFWTLRCWIGT